MFYIAIVWAALTLALFIAVIRLSYRIEARSKPRPPFPFFTNFVATALNIGVARDSQTQALRRRMLILWAAIVLGFIALAVATQSLAPPATDIRS